MMKDILGKEIHIGDFFAYGMRIHNYGALEIGRVEDLDHEKEKITSLMLDRYSDNKQLKKSKSILNFPHRMVLIEPTPEIRTIYEGDCAAKGKETLFPNCSNG